MKKLRILFMGTPEFAVESMDKIHNSEHEIIAAVTAPDKPAGRGGRLRESAVKTYSVDKGIPVWQPTNLKDPDFVEKVKASQPDLIVVVAFRMLPAVIWQIPSGGTINLHASLLPDYRGAAPINWAIVNGEKQTGVTTFFINEKIDTGDIIDQSVVTITPQMDAGELHDLLKTTGAELLLKTVNTIAEGNVQVKSQNMILENGKNVKEAPKITKENSRIDWGKPAEHIVNLIRGMSPYPGAHTTNTFDGSVVKIYKASVSDSLLKPGAIEIDGKKSVKVGTGTKAIALHELQVAGKRKMSVADFLNGLQQPEQFKQFQ